MQTPKVKIGVYTSGAPKISAPGHCIVRENGMTRYVPVSAESRIILHNLLIGKDFHWQKSVDASLPGTVEVHDDMPGMVINIVDAEEYLLRVVGSEMNPDAPEEFLKAHAIISRSWLYSRIMPDMTSPIPAEQNQKTFTDSTIITWQDTDDHIGFDVCSDDHCQRYQGDTPVSEKGAGAIRSTAGLYLADTLDYVADCRFSKCCGGTTELFSSCWQDVDFDYLKAVECRHCDIDSLPSHLRQRLLRSCMKDYDRDSASLFSWQVEVSPELIARNLKERFNRDIGEILDMTPLQRGASGRITLLLLHGSRGDLKIGKELAIRRLLSESHLYSSLFEISRNNDMFLLRGNGWGHGVGLCQIGAATLALEGLTAEEILDFYYPGCHIANINNHNPKA